jgi:hypothetical protein
VRLTIHLEASQAAGFRTVECEPRHQTYESLAFWAAAAAALLLLLLLLLLTVVLGVVPLYLLTLCYYGLLQLLQAEERCPSSSIDASAMSHCAHLAACEPTLSTSAGCCYCLVDNTSNSTSCGSDCSRLLLQLCAYRFPTVRSRLPKLTTRSKMICTVLALSRSLRYCAASCYFTLLAHCRLQKSRLTASRAPLSCAVDLSSCWCDSRKHEAAALSETGMQSQKSRYSIWA